jgi:hypothetical protein
VTRSGRLLLSVIGAFTIATAGVAGVAAAPPEPSANPPAAGAAVQYAAPAAGQVTTTQEPADCAPTATPGKPCDPVGPTSGTLSPNAAFSVTLAASATPVLAGTNVTMTATANQDVLHTIYYIVLLDGSTVVGTPCWTGTTCSWTVTSATPTAVSYMAAIAALDGTSQQASSNIVTVVWMTVPGAPGGVTAVGFHNSAVVSWTAAVSLGSPVSAYTAKAMPGGKNCTWTTGPLTCTISGLIDHTTYSITVTATNASGTGPPSMFSVWVTPLAGSTYHPLTPARILDTRNGTGLSGPFSNHAARTFQVTGRGGVPLNATAVTGNLTVTAQTSKGYLFIGPNAMNDPTSSTLNFPVGDDRANGVTVALGAGGTLSVTFVAPAPGPTTHVLFDVAGYFTTDASGSTYNPLTPTRILDTRSGIGLSGPFSSHVARTLNLGGTVVPILALAVTGNLTVTGQTSPGYLYIGPVAMNNPTSSTLNFPVGDDRANGVTVALNPPGVFSITFVASAGAATAHVVFDVTGYYVPDANGSTFVALNPTRILDTRNGTGGLSGPFSSHSAREFHVSGVGVISANAMVGNLTVTSQTSNGYLYIGPAPLNNPTSSTLNFPVGDDRANGVTVATGAGGALSITFVAPNPGPTAHAIFDVTGYYMP